VSQVAGTLYAGANSRGQRQLVVDTFAVRKADAVGCRRRVAGGLLGGAVDIVGILQCDAGLANLPVVTAVCDFQVSEQTVSSFCSRLSQRLAGSLDRLVVSYAVEFLVLAQADDEQASRLDAGNGVQQRGLAGLARQVAAGVQARQQAVAGLVDFGQRASQPGFTQANNETIGAHVRGGVFGGCKLHESRFLLEFEGSM